MKTSNYILTAFGIFIIASLLVLFIFSKQHQKEENNFSIKEYPVTGFSVIVGEPGATFNMDGLRGSFKDIYGKYDNCHIQPASR
jgi:hypothetical protein